MFVIVGLNPFTSCCKFLLVVSCILHQPCPFYNWLVSFQCCLWHNDRTKCRNKEAESTISECDTCKAGLQGICSDETSQSQKCKTYTLKVLLSQLLKKLLMSSFKWFSNLFIYLFICLFIYLFINLFISLHLNLFTYLLYWYRNEVRRLPMSVTHFKWQHFFGNMIQIYVECKLYSLFVNLFFIIGQ